MYDLVISPVGDLVMAANSDLGGISGTALLEQRMRVRLMLHQGSWAYDTSGTLGSSLYTLAGQAPDKAGAAIEPFVRQALRPMESEISVDEVWIAYQQSDGSLTQAPLPASRAIMVVVIYHVQPAPDEISTNTDQQQLNVLLPLGGF